MHILYLKNPAIAISICYDSLRKGRELKKDKQENSNNMICFWEFSIIMFGCSKIVIHRLRRRIMSRETFFTSIGVFR